MKDFDLASYQKSSRFFVATNNQVVGRFKDEASRQSSLSFAVLKPTMASYRRLNDRSHGATGCTKKKRANGIQRAEVAKLSHEHYKAHLDHPKESYVPIVASLPSFISSMESRHGSEQYCSFKIGRAHV